MQGAHAHARITHQWPLQTARHHPVRSSRPCLRIEACIARRIVCLADARPHRREEHEGFQRVHGEGAVQVPCAKALWCVHPFHPARLQCGQQALVTHACRMQDTDRRVCAHQGPHISRAGAIAHHHSSERPQRLQLRLETLLLAGDQHARCTTLHQQPCCTQPKPSQAARDRVYAVCERCFGQSCASALAQPGHATLIAPHHLCLCNGSQRHHRARAMRDVCDLHTQRQILKAHHAR
eukprot:5409993-Prymnesium_polylepis.1